MSDILVYNRALGLSELDALADKSNTLLEYGNQPLIWTPRVRSYFYGKAPAAPPVTGGVGRLIGERSRLIGYPGRLAG